jgi:formylglycine-generating enzyme required for sulfatase activity
VRWNEAHAFCRWYGKSLPTGAEWLLAARGPGKAKPYSWDGEWRDDREARNIMSRQLVKVNDGGLSWRSSELRHLSGNVAEWLAGAAGGRGAAAGGSCFKGRGATAKKYYAGDEFEELNVNDRRSGVGFRAILRPKDYTQLPWPK